MIPVQNLVKKFGDLAAVNDISLLAAGEIGPPESKP
jgi:ABC-type branched-subunit amino acid transport system ATPase component